MPDKEQTPKRQKADVDMFLWVQQESISVTLTLLKLYAQDLKLTKPSILTSPHTPQFPHSKWVSVLTGVMVNLNHVLSGMHAISNDN